MEKPSRLVIGIMSGTSADGVDAALCRITGHGIDSRIEQLGFVSRPYEEDIRQEVLRLASGKNATAADFCRINFLLGNLFREAALELCRLTGYGRQDIDLIGSHGGDFRVRDMAAGGLGAPLVPYSEFLIYRSSHECVALQNIGGIGNITCLLPNCALEDVFAFDTGPGNMVMDAVMSELTHGAARWDEGGAAASAGEVNEALLAFLMDDEYIRRMPPKTTGREYYGPEYVRRVMERRHSLSVTDADLMATVTAFTAETIAYSVHHFFPRMPDRLVIGGGGSMNKTLIGFIRKALPACNVMTNEEMGFDSNAKEAVAFAVMANEALFAGYNNVPTVTGASHPVIMGKISL